MEALPYTEAELEAMPAGELEARLEQHRADFEAEAGRLISEAEAAELDNPNRPAPAAEVSTVDQASSILFAAFCKVDELLSEGGGTVVAGRELSLVRTKLEEAMLWFGRFQQLQEMAFEHLEQASAEGNDGPELSVVKAPELVVASADGRSVRPASEIATEREAG